MADETPKPVNSLRDDQIITERKLSRRSFVGTVGAFLVGGAAVLVAGTGAGAQETKDQKKDDQASDPDKKPDKGASDPDKAKGSKSKDKKKKKHDEASDPDKKKSDGAADPDKPKN